MCVPSVDDNCFGLWEEQQLKKKGMEGFIYFYIGEYESSSFCNQNRCRCWWSLKYVRGEEGMKGWLLQPSDFAGVCAVGRSHAEMRNEPRRDSSAELWIERASVSGWSRFIYICMHSVNIVGSCWIWFQSPISKSVIIKKILSFSQETLVFQEFDWSRMNK